MLHSKFPIKVEGSRGTIERWRFDEEASYSDMVVDDPRHPYNVLARYRTRVEARDIEELRNLLESGFYYGDPDDWGGTLEEQPYRHALRRLTVRLQVAAIEAEVL